MHVFKKSFLNLFDVFLNLSPTIGGYVGPKSGSIVPKISTFRK